MTGLTSVVTVHDFSLIFDALTQFEESLISAKMDQAVSEETELNPPADEDKEEDEDMVEGVGGEDFIFKDDGKDIDLRLARLEFLIARRPELLNSVMLRQNPHNVSEWHKRVKVGLSPHLLTLFLTLLTFTLSDIRGTGHQADHHIH